MIAYIITEDVTILIHGKNASLTNSSLMQGYLGMVKILSNLMCDHLLPFQPGMVEVHNYIT